LTQYIYGCLFITVYSKQTIETQLLSQSRSKKFIQFSDIYIATSSHALVKYWHIYWFVLSAQFFTICIKYTHTNVWYCLRL